MKGTGVNFIEANSVVLGKYGDGGLSSYTSVAKDIDAQYFQLDNWDELATKYSDEEIWNGFSFVDRRNMACD